MSVYFASGSQYSENEIAWATEVSQMDNVTLRELWQQQSVPHPDFLEKRAGHLYNLDQGIHFAQTCEVPLHLILGRIWL